MNNVEMDNVEDLIENQRASELLEKSIEHWECLASGKPRMNERVGAESCALCQEYLTREFDSSSLCKGCPVQKATGKGLCRDTPYREAEYLAYRYGLRDARFQEAAAKELAFLISLRKK